MIKTIITVVVILIWLYLILRLLRFLWQRVWQAHQGYPQMAMPESVHKQLQPVMQAIGSGDHEGALRYLDQMAGDDLAPVTLAWMHGLRAEILKRQGDVEGEIRALILAIEADPTIHEFHNNLGAAYMRQGRLPEAKRALRAAVEVFPRYANAYYNLGAVYELMGQLEDAAAYYQRALTLAPDDVRSQQGVQRVAGMSGSQPDPKRPTSVNSQLLAEAIRAGNAGNWTQAIEKLRSLLDQDPNNSEARFYLAAAYNELGYWETAKAVASEGLDFVHDDDPWKGRLLYLLGDAMVMLEEDDEAISVLERSMGYASLDPQLDSARINMKLALLRRGRGDEMREDTYRDPRYRHLRTDRIAQPQIGEESTLGTFSERLFHLGDQKRQAALIDCRRSIKAPIDLEQALPVAARVVWDKFQRRIEETILMPEVTPQRFGSDVESIIGQVLGYVDQLGAQALSPRGYDALRRRDLCLLWTAQDDGTRWFLVVLLKK